MVQRVHGGHLAAFNQLVAGHETVAFNLALRLLGDSQSAETVVHEGILLVFQQGDGIDGDSFLYCLLRAIVHICQEHQQHSPIRNATAGTDQVQSRLNQLPFEQRLVLSLADICGLSWQEIGVVIEMPESMVKQLLSRARVSLRTLWFGQRPYSSSHQASLRTV